MKIANRIGRTYTTFQHRSEVSRLLLAAYLAKADVMHDSASYHRIAELRFDDRGLPVVFLDRERGTRYCQYVESLTVIDEGVIEVEFHR